MAEEARSAGATNAAYDIGCPSGPVTSPISSPRPTPIENR
jgi:hypothetical protein